LDYRRKWNNEFKEYLTSLDKLKPVFLCGDLNVAHHPIDLTHPTKNLRSAGFTIEERSDFTDLLASGFVDSYRQLYPEKAESYTYWSYRSNARANNTGWYFNSIHFKGVLTILSYPNVKLIALSTVSFVLM
ncbi:hypothetical protein MXB_3099, partial [Myxobolus squamalis]